MSTAPAVYTDLIAEGEAIDQIVTQLEPGDWSRQTPAVGWTIAHQVAHLASVCRLAEAAAASPEAFAKHAAGASADFDAAVHALLVPYLAYPPADLLAQWRGARAAASEALGALAPERMVPWLARPLPAGVLASAGLMELFAHGQDIADTVGAERHYTDRIWHVVAFAVRTWDFGYLARGLTAPEQEFRFELISPTGRPWDFGPEDGQRITGPAVDFCQLATRRRHRDDLALVAAGADADYWLDIAQAYRGSPGPGRAPGQFASRRESAAR